MRIESTIDIDAPPQRVWAVMADVERWHEWTASIRDIRFETPPPLRAGSRLRIRQPKLPAAIWTVTRVDAGKGFDWRSRGPGLSAFASHNIEALEGDRSRVTLIIQQTGLFAGLIGTLIEGRARRYVDMEANGLKARSESGR